MQLRSGQLKRKTMRTTGKPECDYRDQLRLFPCYSKYVGTFEFCRDGQFTFRASVDRCQRIRDHYRLWLFSTWTIRILVYMAASTFFPNLPIGIELPSLFVVAFRRFFHEKEANLPPSLSHSWLPVGVWVLLAGRPFSHYQCTVGKSSLLFIRKLFLSSVYPLCLQSIFDSFLCGPSPCLALPCFARLLLEQSEAKWERRRMGKLCVIDCREKYVLTLFPRLQNTVSQLRDKSFDCFSPA